VASGSPETFPSNNRFLPPLARYAQPSMIYTHARQFPHLTGKPDAEIRSIAQAAMRQRPRLLLILRLRNTLIVVGMVVGGVLLARSSTLSSGAILMLIGGAGTAIILVWNLVWVNTVLFSVTKPTKAVDSPVTPADRP
jgi:hypothetical protein